MEETTKKYEYNTSSEELNKMIGIPMIPPWLTLQTVITASKNMELDIFNEKEDIKIEPENIEILPPWLTKESIPKKPEIPYVDTEFLENRMSCKCCCKNINKNSYKKHLNSKKCVKAFHSHVNYIMICGDLIDKTIPYNTVAYYYYKNNFDMQYVLMALNAKYRENGSFKKNI